MTESELPEELIEASSENLESQEAAGSEELSQFLESATASEPESPESIEDQLERLTRALSKDPQKHGFEEPVEALATTSEALLSLQMEDDLALQQAEEIQSIIAEEAAAELSETAAPEAVVEQNHVLDLDELQSCMEALLFISDRPISAERLQELLGPQHDLFLFEEALQALTRRYEAIHHGIELTEVNGGFQFRTKIGRADLAKKLVKVQTQRLSAGAMETLAIIAYRQPAMKEDVDQVRGVDSSYFIRNLLDRKLIKITGRSELPGKPMLYSTTSEFLEVFGLKDLSAMPSLRELEQMIPGSEAGREEEDPRIRDMRRMVNEMTTSQESALHYNPEEDEKILKEIKDRVTAIPTSTRTLDELQEKAKAEAAELKAAALGLVDGAQGVLVADAPPLN